MKRSINFSLLSKISLLCINAGKPFQITLLHLLVQFLVALHRPNLSSARPWKSFVQFIFFGRHHHQNHHYSQKYHCNDIYNHLSDYNDNIAPFDKLIMLHYHCLNNKCFFSCKPAFWHNTSAWTTHRSLNNNILITWGQISQKYDPRRKKKFYTPTSAEGTAFGFSRSPITQRLFHVHALQEFWRIHQHQQANNSL